MAMKYSFTYLTLRWYLNKWWKSLCFNGQIFCVKKEGMRKKCSQTCLFLKKFFLECIEMCAFCKCKYYSRRYIYVGVHRNKTWVIGSKVVTFCLLTYYRWSSFGRKHFNIWFFRRKKKAKYIYKWLALAHYRYWRAENLICYTPWSDRRYINFSDR